MTDVQKMLDATIKPDADALTWMAYADAVNEAGQEVYADIIRKMVALGKHPLTGIPLGMVLVTMPASHRKSNKVWLAMWEARIPMKRYYPSMQKSGETLLVPFDRLEEARKLGAKRSRYNDRRR